MQKRLSVARAVLIRPPILLVDEATANLDPEAARRVKSLIRGLADDGAAVLWTTQRVDEVPGFADSTTLLLDGRVVFSGSPAQLAARAPSERYLIEIRDAKTGRAAPLAAVQLAVGPGVTILPTGDADHFLLDPNQPSGLGSALARLVEGGFQVIGCRQAQSEMEEAFLVLTGAAA